MSMFLSFQYIGSFSVIGEDQNARAEYVKKTTTRNEGKSHNTYI